MASYSAVIDLRVNGLNNLKTIEQRVSAVDGVLKQLKPIPALFEKARSDKIQKAKKDLSDYVNAVGKGSQRGKVFSTTIAGLNAQIRAFSTVAANATQGSDEFNNAIRASERASIRLAQAEAQRLKVQQEFFTGRQPEGQSTAVQDILKLGSKLPKTIAGLEFYQQQLRQTQEQVLLGSNAFRALEEAIADVNERLASSRLTGQTSKIQAVSGPATDLGSLKAFQAREKFEAQILQQQIRQFAISQRINQANLEETEKSKLRLFLAESSNELLNNDLVISKQITTEIERQRMSLERAKRAREQGATRRTGQFSPLQAPERLKNIQNSAVLVQEKLNTLSAKGVDVSKARSQVEQLILRTKDDNLQLDLKTLNLLDDELNGLRQVLKLENQILQTTRAQIAASKKANKDKDAGRKRFGQAAVGAAFPALFGGGPLSILGGGIGEFIGAGAGVPLGGVVGSAIGQTLEQVAVQVSEFGNALVKPTENLELLARAAGLAGTRAGAQIKTAEFLGAPELAGRIAKDELTGVIGQRGTKGLEDLGRESTELANNFENLKAQTSATFAPFFAGLARVGNAILGGGRPEGSPAQRVTEIQGELRQLEGQRGRGATGARNRLTRELAEQEALLAKNSLTEQQTNTIINGRLGLLQDATSLEQNRNILGRVALATQESQLAVNKANQEITELEIRQKSLEAGVEKDILGLQIKQAEERKKALQAAQQNAIDLARIAVERDTKAEDIKAFQAQQKQLDIAQEINELTDSDVNNFQRKLAALERQAQAQIAIKKVETEMTLLTVKEDSLREQIRETLGAELDVIKEQYRLDVERVRQAEILRKATKQRKVDELAISKLQAQKAAEAQIRQTSPETIGQFLGSGFGFFDQSNRLEDELLQKRIDQLQVYEAQIGSLKREIEGLEADKVDPELISPKQKELERLKTAVDSYKNLQPQIDAAAVAQQRFNEAFALTSPLVDSLANGIKGIVEGTQTVKQAFADFLRDIGDLLIREAARMIKTYIALGIAKAFAFGGGGGGSTDSFAGVPNNILDSVIGPRATGGPTRPHGTYLVGEQGPELLTMGNQSGFVHRNTSEAMDRYRAGRSSSGGGGSLNVNYNVTQINGMNFVTEEQFRAGMTKAAKDGAKMGEAGTFKSMRNSRSNRARVGL